MLAHVGDLKCFANEVAAGIVNFLQAHQEKMAVYKHSQLFLTNVSQ